MLVHALKTSLKFSKETKTLKKKKCFYRYKAWDL